MGETYEVREIRPEEKPLMEQLLQKANLRKDARLDYSAGVFDGGDLIAAGSCSGNTLRCIAVNYERQGEGILNQLLQHLIQVQYHRGNYHIFLYTKPMSAQFFKDLGFYEIAGDGDRTVFLENRKQGWPNYLHKLQEETEQTGFAGIPGGALVMNANPFTFGHRYLAEYAAARCEVLHIFVVSEDVSAFSAADRMEMVRRGTAHLSNVVCHHTDSYLISQATFPSYFLPDDKTATLSQASLDGIVFAMLAKRLRIHTRFLGTEPFSRTTALYNQVLSQVLPRQSITCEIVPRKEFKPGSPISASEARKALATRDWNRLEKLVPFTTLNYLRKEMKRGTEKNVKSGEKCP